MESVTEVPGALLATCRDAGAKVRSEPYPHNMNKWFIDGIVHGSDAWKAYMRWALSQSVSKGPTIVCHETYKPGEDADDYWKVVDEVRSILKHFSALTIEAFEEGPSIPGPTQDISALESVKHPKLAMAMFEIIQSPPPTYVAINALDSGSFICAIVHMWGHCSATIEIFRK